VMDENDLQSQSVKQLRVILSNRGIDFADCIEKTDLINKILSTAHLETKIGPITSQTVQIKSLQCIIVQNTTQPDLVVVLAHGFGANAKDLVSLAYEILRSPSLKNKAIKIVFPNGPLVLEFMGGGRAWWNIDLHLLMMRVMQGQLLQIINEVPPGLESARNQFKETLEEIKAQTNLPWSKFILGGFSQGAIISTDICLQITEEAIGGLVVLSGAMVNAENWKNLAGQRKPGTKVLQSHGTKDQILPYVLAMYLKQFLEQHFTVDFVEFDGGHTITDQVVTKFIQLIETI